jgi:Peptidase family M20/M25/M40
MTMIRSFRSKSREQRRFVAEAVADGIDRRKLLGSVCACGFATLLDLELTCFAAAETVAAPARAIHGKLDADAAAIASKMVAWRRDIHQNPELGNREVRTAGLVAQHLRQLGCEVREKVAVTGVVATLVGGGGPGAVVALRADMDALPVAEPQGLPFASTARANWGGEDVGVMHACGHDCHVAIMMAVAENPGRTSRRVARYSEADFPAR